MGSQSWRQLSCPCLVAPPLRWSGICAERGLGGSWRKTGGGRELTSKAKNKWKVKIWLLEVIRHGCREFQEVIGSSLNSYL